MRTIVACALVFFSGFAIMVLEIIGARFLARDFGGSFYVWVSQIGVIMMALALGYYLGGALADRSGGAAFLAWLLVPSGVFTFFIPDFASSLLASITLRHPAGEGIPPLWMKLDPALGSAVIFLLPGFALAAAPPGMIRWATCQVTRVGRTSGTIIAASTVGSIAGVFVSGYVLIDHMRIPDIFRATGALTVVLGLACGVLDRVFRENPAESGGNR